MKKIRIISLIALIVTTFVSLDLLINLIGSLIPSMNDGISVHSIIWGNLYFGEDGWSHQKFFDGFVISSLIAFAVFVENIVLSIICIVKKQK